MNYKVLVVDDQKIYPLLIEKALEEHLYTYQIVKAINGHEACTLCELEKPDLLLMDWEMPEMTGIEAIKKLKASPKTASIPIIIISSKSKEEYAHIALEAGASDFVEKPFKKEHLLERIEKILKLKMVV